MGFNILLMLKYKIHPPGSQRVESLRSSADVFVLCGCLCLRAGSPPAPLLFPLRASKSPDFGDLLRKDKTMCLARSRRWGGRRWPLCGAALAAGRGSAAGEGEQRGLWMCC